MGPAAAAVTIARRTQTSRLTSATSHTLSLIGRFVKSYVNFRTYPATFIPLCGAHDRGRTCCSHHVEGVDTLMPPRAALSAANRHSRAMYSAPAPGVSTSYPLRATRARTTSGGRRTNQVASLRLTKPSCTGTRIGVRGRAPGPDRANANVCLLTGCAAGLSARADLIKPTAREAVSQPKERGIEVVMTGGCVARIRGWGDLLRLGAR